MSGYITEDGLFSLTGGGGQTGETGFAGMRCGRKFILFADNDRTGETTAESRQDVSDKLDIHACQSGFVVRRTGAQREVVA